MSQKAAANFETLGFSRAVEVDRACDAFELAWKAGMDPRIEDFLTGIDAMASEAALRELIALDVYYRRLDYGRRFPEFTGDGLTDDGAAPRHPVATATR